MATPATISPAVTAPKVDDNDTIVETVVDAPVIHKSRINNIANNTLSLDNGRFVVLDIEWLLTLSAPPAVDDLYVYNEGTRIATIEKAEKPADSK